MHTRTTDSLVHVKQILPLAEGVDQNSRTTTIVAMRTQPHEVVKQTSNLRKHDPDVLRAHRNIDTQQLFNSQAVGVLIAHH